MDLWKKKFIIIWSGQLFSILRSAIVGYSVMFWLSIETKSAEVLSYAVLATLLPVSYTHRDVDKRQGIKCIT